jgi:hypothetical protein
LHGNRRIEILEDIATSSRRQIIPIRRNIVGVLRRANAVWWPASAPLTIMLVVTLLRTAALTHVVVVPLTDIEVRSFGNPQEALHRISTENVATIEQLDELIGDPRLPDLQRQVYRHAPIILQDDTMAQAQDDIFIGVYYLASETRGEESVVMTIQYFYFSTDENGGTLIRTRLALFGQPIDRELIYRVTLVDGELASAHYQAPLHRLTSIEYGGDEHPVFEVASANHNFRPVSPAELEQRRGYRLIVPMPRHELGADPAHDPDFVALAAREALNQYGIDLSNYVYVEFQNPVHDGIVSVSIKLQGRWYYLHDSVPGLTRPGYNKVGILVGFSPQPESIEAIWVVASTPDPVDLEVISIYIYPRLEIPM